MDTLIDNNKAVIYFQTDRFSLKNLSMAPLHLDGDPADCPEAVDCRILPGCFDLISGK